MREIKFRAYSQGVMKYNLNTIRLHRKYLDMALMQFTGLKDKNGVEIYELCELNNRYIVVYIAPKFVLYDILKNDILDIYEQATITKEYCELSKDQKRVINKYIS